MDRHPKVTALAASGRKVIVGTDVGIVGIVESESCRVLHLLHWHTEKVRTLLLMPREMEPCICSEIPLPEPPETFTNILQKQPTRKLIHQPFTIGESEYVSFVENPYKVSNMEPEKTMVASIGNGRRKFIQDKSDRTDVCMLVWKC